MGSDLLKCAYVKLKLNEQRQNYERENYEFIHGNYFDDYILGIYESYERFSNNVASISRICEIELTWNLLFKEYNVWISENDDDEHSLGLVYGMNEIRKIICEVL